MDRPLETGVRRMRLLRRLLYPLAGAALTITLVVTVIGWIRPSFRREEIRTAVVERGTVAAFVTATGNVVPEHEQVITSPIEARVIRIHSTPGDPVGAGQPILQLDTTETRAALEQLDARIALKRNQREETLLENARQRNALLTRREIQELELHARLFEAERSLKHLEDGLFSRDEVRHAENEARKAEIELRQIDESLANLEGALEKQLKGLDLEIAIDVRDRRDMARRLEQATVSSEYEGVLTHVVSSEGMSVSKGEEIARVADLRSYRVEATVSDIHAARLVPGLPVTVESGENRMDGRITNIRPKVENGIVTLEADMEDRSAPFLRHNLRVDVYIVLDRITDALRVPRGFYRMPDGTEAAFVLKDGVAVRTPVRFGITNIDYYQVLDGLAEGDEVIISDVSDSMHLEEVEVR